MKIQQLIEQTKPRKCVYVKMEGTRELTPTGPDKIDIRSPTVEVAPSYPDMFDNMESDYWLDVTRDNLEDALDDFESFIPIDRTQISNQKLLKELKQKTRYASKFLIFLQDGNSYVMEPVDDSETGCGVCLVAVIRQ